MLRLGHRLGGTPLVQLSPAQQAVRRASAQQLTTQMAHVDREERRHERVPFTVVATQDQLNTLLQDRIKTHNLPIHDLSLELDADSVAVQATVNYRGFDVPATAHADLGATAGQVTVKVTSVDLAGLPAPVKIKDSLNLELSRQLNRALGSRGGTIDTVTVEPGKLTVTGVT